MKAIEQYFDAVVLFITLHKVNVNFTPVYGWNPRL